MRKVAGSLIGTIGVGTFLWATAVNATSLSVDNASVGQWLSALAAEPPPAENDIFNSAFNSLNVKDVDNALLNPPPGAPLPQVGPPNLNALSAGAEPLDAGIWDIIFSVDRASTGAVGSSVNFRVTTGNAAASDLFFTNPALQGTNRWLVANHTLGLQNGVPPGGGDNIDAAEVFDSRNLINPEARYTGFTVNGDNVYLSTSGGGIPSGDIFVDGPGGVGPGAVYFPAVALGLGVGDDVDALALDANLLPGDGVVEALFSLAPGSPSLAAFGLSPADILYTDFSGAFDIAGPTGLLGNFAGNLNFAFDLTAANLGLLFTDNVDALDIVATSTPFFIPQNAAFPVDRVVIVGTPEPSIIALLGIGLAGIGVSYRRNRAA